MSIFKVCKQYTALSVCLSVHNLEWKKESQPKEGKRERRQSIESCTVQREKNLVPLVFEHFGRWGERQKHICQVWHQDQEAKQGERTYQTSSVIGEDELQSKYKTAMQK